MEKVDYALKINGEPVVFVECKAADVALDTHDGQLARYFNTTPSVRVGILTNGVRIKVFTYLQQPNEIAIWRRRSALAWRASRRPALNRWLNEPAPRRRGLLFSPRKQLSEVAFREASERTTEVAWRS